MLKAKLKKESISKSLKSLNIKNFFNDDHISYKRTAPKFPNSILSELPYDYYDQDKKLFHNLLACADEKKYEETCGFILNAYLKSGISREDIKILSDFFNSALPENSIVQIINYSSPRYRDLFDNWMKNKEKEGGIYTRLAQKRVDFFNKGAWDSFFDEPLTIKDYNLYICVSISKKIKNYDQKLISLREKLINKLKNINLFVNNSNPEILLSFLDEILNPSRKKFRKSNIKWDKLNTISSSLVAGSDSTIVSEKDKIILRDTIEARSFTVSSYPDFWAAFNTIELSGSEDNSQLRLNCPSIISLTLKISNQEKQKTSIIARKSVLSNRFNSKARSLWTGIEEQYKDYKYVSDKIEKSDNKIFQSKFDIILMSPKENLEKETEKLISIYKTKNWKIIQNDYVHLPSFLSTLPFYTSLERFDKFSKLGKTKKIISWTSTNIAPMQGEYRGNAMDDPYLILFGKRGQPIFWNPFTSAEGGNFNMATTGQPGSGKSVISQEIAMAVR
ncbi:MAG: conjugal transfer ATP-binding protein TraC, partial [Rickettsiales bacterium]